MLALEQGITVVVEKCSAEQDGGGMALLEVAALSFEFEADPSGWIECQGKSYCCDA